jgi:hypothetical protein
MIRIVSFGIGLLVLGFFLPFFKNMIDFISSNTTGVLSWANYTSFEIMIIDLAPIYFPICIVTGLLIMLGRKRQEEQRGNY